jgi:hypothetical protein
MTKASDERNVAFISFIFILNEKILHSMQERNLLIMIIEFCSNTVFGIYVGLKENDYYGAVNI